MILIKNTLISLDVIERFFACDLSKCLGQCCIDGDAGAPLSEDEKKNIENNIEKILPLLSDAAQETIKTEGVAYKDSEGDLVTSLVNGSNCVFTTFAENGVCLCALEKGYHENLLPKLKPSSCHLYPIRLKKCGEFTGLNYHRWKICKCGEVLGRKENIRVFEFLKEPLIDRFGEEWYKELELTAREWLSSCDKGFTPH